MKKQTAGEALSVLARNAIYRLLSDQVVDNFSIEPLGRRELRKLLREQAAKKRQPLSLALLRTPGCGYKTTGEILKWLGEKPPRPKPTPPLDPEALHREVRHLRALVEAAESPLPDAAMTKEQVAFRKRITETMNEETGSREALLYKLGVARDALQAYVVGYDGGERARAVLNYLEAET